MDQIRYKFVSHSCNFSDVGGGGEVVSGLGRQFHSTKSFTLPLSLLICHPLNILLLCVVEIGSLAPRPHSIIQKKRKRQHLTFQKVIKTFTYYLIAREAITYSLETDQVPPGEVSIRLLSRKGERIPENYLFSAIDSI